MSMDLWECQQEEAMAAYHEELYENELKVFIEKQSDRTWINS